MAGAGRIIKADQVAPQSPTPFRPDDALARIEVEVQAANSKLAQDRQRATAEVQTVYDKAHVDGYRDGYEKGLQQGLSEQEAAYASRLKEEVSQRVTSVIASLEGAIADLQARPAEWVKKWEPEGTELVLSIARRVARQAVARDGEVITRTLTEILSMIARAPRITVHLHPTDLETLEMHPERWRSAVSKSTEIEFVTDESLTRGGCQVATETCTVDATVETQIDRLLAELAQVTAGDSSESGASIA